MNERRRGTHRRLLARAWGWWLARTLFLGLAFYSCLVLLQSMALLAELGTSHGASSIEVEPVQPVPIGERVVLRGRAPAGSVVQVGAESRVLDIDLAERGRFEIGIPRSPRSSLIWLRALDRHEGRQRGQRYLSLPPAPPASYPLTVDLATPVAGRLWVAGQGPPGEPLRILANGLVLGETQADGLGIYDALLEAGTLPREVTVASPWGVSPAAAVTAARLPLARTADIHWTATDLQTSLWIGLPAVHPYFLALSEGSLSFPAFVESVFGFLPISGRGQPVVTIANGRGEVRFTGEPIQTSESLAGIFAHPAKGISSAPLLSGHDRITFHFGGLTPWILPPLPVEMANGRATWRGPAAAPSSGPIVLLGRDPRSATEPPAGQEPPEQKNLREFVQRFEDEVRANLLRQTWRSLIVLIPFLMVVILARKAAFGRAMAWKSLAAAAVILAIWRSWALLLVWISAGPGSWLNRLMAPLWSAGLGSAAWAERFWDTHANAFWLLFVTLVAMVPLYFDDAVRAGLRWHPRVPRRRRAPWRRVLGGTLTGLRALASALLLALLFAVLHEVLSSRSWLLLREVHERAQRAWEGDWIPPNLVPAGTLLLLLALLLLVLFGLRGALFAAGLLAVGARWAVEGSFQLDVPFFHWMAEVPWGFVLLFAGLTALPLVARFLGVLVPFTREQGRIRWLVSAALVALSLLMPRLPTSWLLASAGALMVLGLGWVAVQALPRAGALAWLGAWADRSPASFLTALFVAGLALAWPFGVKDPGLVELGSFASELGQVFPYVLALGVVLLLLDDARGRGSVLLPPEILKAGGYFYAVFLLNSSSTWLFVPVAFLAGLFLAGVWLFRPKAETDELAAALPEGQRNPRLLIQSVIDSTELGSRFLRIRQALTEKLETMDLKPQEYEERLAEYQAYLKSKVDLGDLPHGVEPRTLVFAVGEPTVQDNTVAALRWGAILSLGPLLVAVYQYLPSRGVSHAFPIMDLLTFLIGASASWLLYSFFFGYFFVHLRGNSGLAKGSHLFSMVAIPFAVDHLLHASTFDQVRPFLFWIAQVFLFFTLLGLLAFDYGLLRKNGFRFKDLRLVHDMPALSAYASTVVAAVVPAVVAVVTGEVKDVVSFFLENILPHVPS